MTGDVENGKSNLYSMIHDIPQKRISFIQKIYSIIIFQLLFTFVVVSVVISVRPVANFLNDNLEYKILDIVAFFAFCSICYYHNKHSLGYFFLLIFTVSVALSVGLKCALIGGALAGGKIIILKVATLTTAVVLSSSLYIIWATKRGHDFISLDPSLFGALLVLIFIGLIQILFPLEKLSDMIYLCLASTIIYGYIVYVTDNLIKRFTYAQCIWVSASLYLYDISLFLSLHLIFVVAELIKTKKI